MYTRSAIFEGSIREGREAEFWDIVENRLLPIWRRMPHVEAVRLFRPVAADAGAPGVVLVQQIDYPSLAAIDAAMASSVRAEAVEASKPLAELFDGRHYHYVYEKRVAG